MPNSKYWPIPPVWRDKWRDWEMTDLLRQLVSMALAIIAMPFALLVDGILFLADWISGE